jgi:hypothetical protein
LIGKCLWVQSLLAIEYYQSAAQYTILQVPINKQMHL